MIGKTVFLFDARYLGVCIEANKEGLISLARHILELAQEDVPEFEHIHLDEYNSLEDNSAELTIVKRKEFSCRNPIILHPFSNTII